MEEENYLISFMDWLEEGGAIIPRENKGTDIEIARRFINNREKF